MIDLHAHVLPGIDDGPADVADAVALVRLAQESGTTTIVATPHLDLDHDVAPAQIRVAVEAFRLTLLRAGIEGIELLPGAEIAIPRLVTLSPAELDEVTLGNGPTLLVESPLEQAAGDFERVILELREAGRPVLLAHPERCPSFQREPARLTRLLQAGCWSSVTAGSISGRFGQTVQAFTFDLLRRGEVHSVDSDAHDATRRPPWIGRAFETADAELPGLLALKAHLTEVAPAAILRGEQPPPGPPPPRRPGLLGRLRRRA